MIRTDTRNVEGAYAVIEHSDARAIQATDYRATCTGTKGAGRHPQLARKCVAQARFSLAAQIITFQY